MSPQKKPKTARPQRQTIRVVGVGLLKTTNLGAVIQDVKGSATWSGKGYVVDTVGLSASATTKVFTLKFGLNFTTGAFNTIGGANGTITADGAGNTQTLKITGRFGQGVGSETAAGYLAAGTVHYNNGVSGGEVFTNALYGLIGRGGAIGVFFGGGLAGANGYAGGFWAGPSTTATTASYANYLEFYRAEIKDTVNIAAPSGRADFVNGTFPDAIDSPIFRLGGADDTLVTNKNGIHFNVYDNVKTVRILGEADLGVINPNTKASATWLGRLFVKTDETAFNIEHRPKTNRLATGFCCGNDYNRATRGIQTRRGNA